MSKPEIASLLERVKAATGPDREIDARLFVLLVQEREWRDDGHVVYAQKSPSDAWRVGYMDSTATGRNFRFGELSVATMVDGYTASIDAALALVERKLPGLVICMTRLGDGSGMFQVTEAWAGDNEVVDAFSPMDPRPGALAVIEVLLTALLSEAQP